MKARLLIIEDNQSLAASLQNALQVEGYEVHVAPDADQGLSTTKSVNLDVVITDLQLAGPQGMDATAGLTLIRELHDRQPNLPVILMTAHHTTQTAIEATKLGAFDYILKPFEIQGLMDLIAHALESKRLMSGPVEVGTAAHEGDVIIGNSRPMQDVYKEIGRIAEKPVTVLIRGETGTGKELIARAIYHHSDREGRPFIIVNCVAIPETLLESELFGHEQGAFTGASARRIGRFEQANGGTIFLDEIGDMSLSTQGKLLRVLQEKTIQRLGGKETLKVDVRVLAATHRDLDKAMEAGQFRRDLYYRLNDSVISLPPLRERQDDVPYLVNYFLAKHGAELRIKYPSLDAKALSNIPSPEELTNELDQKNAIRIDAMQELQQQQWPGNVRELLNVVRRAIRLAGGRPIMREVIRQALTSTRPPPPATGETLTDYIRELLTAAARGDAENVAATVVGAAERELYEQAITLAGGNQAKAAKWLGVSRPTMREKLRAYNLRAMPETTISPE